MTGRETLRSLTARVLELLAERRSDASRLPPTWRPLSRAAREERVRAWRDDKERRSA